MYKTLVTLVDRLDRDIPHGTTVLEWGGPVPSFGDIESAQVATLGLNPSNREFLDNKGNELQGAWRRFHSLKSLGLESWSEAEMFHLRKILESCRNYFSGNPYTRWFRKLEVVLSGADLTYFGDSANACHLDLIPYATAQKWGDLSKQQQNALLSFSCDSLGLLLQDSPVDVLILNGRSVLEHFQALIEVKLESEVFPDWALPRNEGPDVVGKGYRGVVQKISGIDLHRSILILGYNHNIQSSFGVTNKVIFSIRDWVALSVKEYLNETP